MKSSTLKTKGFKFKQFSIEGGQSGMPVSTDGVMLGAWAFEQTPTHILDIGTGTGLLALMCAQRFPNCKIEAIDIDEHAYAAATTNIDASPWKDRVTVQLSDVLERKFNHGYNGIICNPPYFNSGEHAQHSQRATARHTHTLNHESLVKVIGEILTSDGKASFVLPVTEGEQFIDIAERNGLFISRLCSVRPTANKPANRVLFELQKEKVDCQKTELIVRDEMGYTEAFVALTRSFYLKM